MSFAANAGFPNYSPKITDEELNQFYSIDRELYSRLIFNLGRDPEQSMQVIGFWMWLELAICSKLDLVAQLLKLPCTVLNEVADESVTCLKCVESDILPFTDGVCELVLLPNLVDKDISLQFFHEHRSTVIHGVARRVNKVCVRAFKDILQKNYGEKYALISEGSGGASEIDWSNEPILLNLADGKVSSTLAANEAVFFKVDRPVGNKSSSIFSTRDGLSFTTAIGKDGGRMNGNSPSFTPSSSNIGAGYFINGDRRISTAAISNNASCITGAERSLEGGLAIPFPYGIGNTAVIGYPVIPPTKVIFHIPPGGALNTQQIMPAANVQPYANASAQRDIQSCELSPMLGSLNVASNVDNVPPDDRTIFLTFSKGYPISEFEVREFFTRKFGDFIEAIYMQEVPSDEQVLYARVICSSVSIVDVIVEGGKAKYSINGKHIWARKYVKKNNWCP